MSDKKEENDLRVYICMFLVLCIYFVLISCFDILVPRDNIAYLYVCYDRYHELYWISIYFFYTWAKGELLWSLSLIHAYITLWVLSSSKKGILLAQKPIILVLIMINLCNYSSNDLVLIKFPIFKQDFGRCLASTKNSKSSSKASTCWFKSSRFKIP